MKIPIFPLLLAAWSVAFLSTPAHASVTNVAWYRLGENDPGAASGVAATNTADLVGLNHLSPFNSPRYTNAVSPNAANAVASALSVQFNSVSGYFSNAVVSTAIDNIGIELWARPDSTISGNRILAYNGNAGPNGWGLIQASNRFMALLGGVTTIGSAPVSIGSWTHLALVRRNGLSTVYVNGFAAASSASAPNTPAGGFAIGARPSFPSEFFDGAIDEVRVFTFEPSLFSTDDLLVNQQLVATLPANNFAPGAATLNGSAASFGFSTTVRFEWGISPNLSNTTIPQALGSDFNTTNFSQVITGLTAGAYHFRAIATNDLGIAFGVIQPFILGPSVQTLPATGLTNTSATLNGAVNPGGNNATAWFEWGATTNYGNATAPQALGSGTAPVNMNEVLTGLFGGTYHFRAVASNSFGLVFGTNHAFTLPLFALAITNLPGLTVGTAAWGDSDNDGRLDLLLAGIDGARVLSEVWRNNTNGFSPIPVELTGVTGDYWPSAVAWGDYDRDGRLDIALAGSTDGGFVNAATEFWANIPPGFIRRDNSLAALPKLVSGAVEWGDYDNDGRLDLLVAGYEPSMGYYHCDLWRNEGIFIEVDAQLPPFEYGVAKWGDYDNDGDLDLLIAGRQAGTQLLRQTAGAFTNVVLEVAPGLANLEDAAAAWGDFDNDGRLDFLIAGNGISGLVCQLWRNTGSTFTNVPIPGLRGISFGSLAWGDCDNDGWLDFLVTGATNLNADAAISELWRNTGSGFTNLPVGLPGVSRGTAVWGDYDNDGRLDIALMGTNTDGSRITAVYRNQMLPANSPPSAPTELDVAFANGTAVLSWNAATDSTTPAAGLTYNVRAGTGPGQVDLISPQSGSNGFRRLPAMGNAQMRRFSLLEGLTNGQTVFWSVQAVDTGLAGGPFAAESSFTFAPRLSITATGTSVTISWSPSLPGWVLQEASSLPAPAWSNSLSGGTNPITVAATNAAEFYRLSFP